MSPNNISLIDLATRLISYRTPKDGHRHTGAELLVSGGQFSHSNPVCLLKLTERLNVNDAVYVGELIAKIDNGNPYRGVQIGLDEELHAGDVIVATGGHPQLSVSFLESGEEAGQIEYMASQVSETIWQLYLRPEELSACSSEHLSARRGPRQLVHPLLTQPLGVPFEKWAAVEGLIDAECCVVFRSFAHPQGGIASRAIQQAARYLETLSRREDSLRTTISTALDSGDVRFVGDDGHSLWASVDEECVRACFKALTGAFKERVELAALRYRLRAKTLSPWRPILIG